MRILVGCEESQAVTIELRKLGHEAYSCDVLPCSGGHPEWHLQMDVFWAIAKGEWDMGIFFPPCTYLCSSGLHWNGRTPGRAEKTEAALRFVCRLLNLNSKIPKIAIENPVGCISTRIFRYSGPAGERWEVFPKSTYGCIQPAQTIQPYNFGEDASKKTCLYLLGLPPLKPTQYVEPRIVADGLYKGKKRWSNQTDSGQNKLGPSEKRGMERSKTFPGIAKAIAQQWGNSVPAQTDLFTRLTA